MNLKSCAAGLALAVLPLSVFAQTTNVQKDAPDVTVTRSPVDFETILRQAQPRSNTSSGRLATDAMATTNVNGSGGSIYLDGSIDPLFGIYSTMTAANPGRYTKLGNSAAGTYSYLSNSSGFPLLRVEASGGLMMALPGTFNTTNPTGAQITMFETTNQNHDILIAYGNNNQAIARLQNVEGAANVGALLLFQNGILQTTINGSANNISFFKSPVAIGASSIGSGLLLDVAGTARATTLNATTANVTTVNATTVNSVNGITAVYQDLAEWVPSSEKIDDGTVVVVNPDASNEVSPSSHAYQTSVAGVVSANPGVLLGKAGDDKAKIATTGRVKVKVDASHGAIRPGDLLVTSDKRGVAMKSQPVSVGGLELHRPGTLVGKALEPLASGEGEILVLLSLQ
jgi:hypothetical protein